ncbi:hypothetical protein PSH03_003456 [Micromonospora sp. PSH03]|uniref:hypothetical protein n=1 Tax=Micromonospora TaxID=1873 RepID=UPI001EE877C6|nr:hypothetical protein [Micromonospora salmantinae]MCG5458275.1 hypothetical protein [Micromonospora salmantinae]
MTESAPRRLRTRTVLTRDQARAGVRGHRVPVTDVGGATLVVRCDIPPGGASRRRSLRLTRAALEKKYPGRDWPDEQLVQITVPDWRWRYALAALCVLAGLIAEAWLYAFALALICAALAVSAAHARLHDVDRFDPAVRRGFAATLRDNLAGTARLYLFPLGAVLALYLVAAAVLGSLIVPTATQDTILATQNVLDDAADLVGKLKLPEWGLALVLLGAWLLTSLLTAAGTPGAAGAWLNGIVRGYGRYSGPAVATVTALSVFTLLTGTVATLRGRVQLAAEWTTDDYRHAAAAVEERLAGQVLEQVVRALREQLPTDYQQVLAGTVSVQVISELERIRAADGDRSRDDPVVATEEDRVARRGALPDQSVITVSGDAPALPTPGDLTGEDAETARRWADTAPPVAATSVATDGGKEVLAQMPKVATELAAWKRLGDWAQDHHPAAKPLIDAVAEAFDTQLQDRLRAQVPPLVRKISARSGDVQAAMSTAVRDLTATIDIPAIAGRYADQARQAVTAAQNTLSALTARRQQSTARAALLTELLQGNTHERALADTANASEAVRRAVVAELRSTIDTTTASPDLRRAAAVTLHNLSGRGVREVTATDLAKAVRICGCGT